MTKGFGWAIAKALAESGAEIIIGTWTPIMRLFSTSLATVNLMSHAVFPTGL